MRNPARRLHEIFTAWSTGYGPSTAAVTARGLESKSDDAYSVQVEAFRLIIEIGQALTYLESRAINVDVYRRELKNWIDIVLHSPNAWTGPSDTNTGFPPTPLAHLETLVILLEVDRPALSAKPEHTLRTVIAQVLELLVDDDAISDTLRSYIYRLVSEMRTALDDESVAGIFDFADAAERLWVAMQAASGQSRSNKGRWRKASGDLFRDAGAAALGSMPTLALTVMQMMQTGVS